MKLKKLKIKKYKNLIDFNVNFETGKGLSILIGNNGSGKSNVLEAISGIFANAYAAKAMHKFVYSLTYEIEDKEVKLEQTEYKCQYFVDSKAVSAKELILRNLLPTNVIAVYSGEDSRWWHDYYEPFYSKYINDIKNGTGNNISPKMYYINKHYWDIALLSLIYSTAEDDKEFLRDIIGRDAVDHILLFYTQNVEKDCKSEGLKSFLQSINYSSGDDAHSDDESAYLYKMTQKDISDTYGIQVIKEFSAGKDFYVFVDAQFLNNKPETFNYYEKELFDYFAQAYMPKNKKIIKNIELVYNGYSAKDLSEGEKKLILIRAVLSFVADENSLVLFDEPDANIHEGRKQQIYDLFTEYSKYNRQIIITTHSPIIAQLAKEKELLMLELEDGKASIITDEKIEKIKKLSGTSWDIIGQGMIFKSNRALVVFEGKTDVLYVKKALNLLRETNPRYENIGVDLLNANGAGNIKSFIENLKDLVPTNKKIIIFFDRDNAGREGARAVTSVSKDDERIVRYQDIKQGNIIVSFIPYKTGITEGDFLIEDYFSWEHTVKAIVKDIIPDDKHPFKNMPSLSGGIKKEIERRVDTFGADEFIGFIPLLDKILELSEGESR